MSFLEHRHLRQSPDDRLWSIGEPSGLLRDYLNGNALDICAERHTVPRFYSPGTAGLGLADEIFPGYPPAPAGSQPFLATRARFVPAQTFDVEGILGRGSCAPTLVRHKFVLNTCSGCHSAETDTLAHHVHPGDSRTPPGLLAQLSRFMTGTETTAPFTPIPDPATFTAPGAPRHFNDLLRRAQILEELATNSCFVSLRIPFLEPVHPFLEEVRPFPKPVH